MSKNQPRLHFQKRPWERGCQKTTVENIEYKLHSLARRHIQFRGRAGKGMWTMCPTATEIALNQSCACDY
jgi:hypothetical protein